MGRHYVIIYIMYDTAPGGRCVRRTGLISDRTAFYRTAPVDDAQTSGKKENGGKKKKTKEIYNLSGGGVGGGGKFTTEYVVR